MASIASSFCEIQISEVVRHQDRLDTRLLYEDEASRVAEALNK